MSDKEGRIKRGTTTIEITTKHLDIIKQIATKKKMKIWGVLYDILEEYFNNIDPLKTNLK